MTPEWDGTGVCPFDEDAVPESADVPTAVARAPRPRGGAAKGGRARTGGAAPKADGKRREERGPSQADQLVALAAGAELFHDRDGTAYASVDVDGHRETWPIRSRGFRDWLVRAYYATTTKAPNAEAIGAALGVLEARARYEGDEIAVHVRLGEHEGAIYLDLADATWRVVQVTAEGWAIIGSDECPVRFRRSRGMLPLPEPERGGSIRDLRGLINLGSERDWILLAAWLVAALRPRGPYPILALQAEHGAAKSYAARILRGLVDPSTSPIRSRPREEGDLLIATRHGWLIALDNLSGLSTDLSDALCRLATGGGMGKRELFTDAEEVLIDAQRPIILTGIDAIATRGDLADRAIVLALPAIPEERRRTEDEVGRAYEAARPRILGAMLEAVACALRRRDVRPARLPRMADFGVWATAAEPGLGLPDGAVLEAYSAARGDLARATVDADPVAAALAGLAERGWRGTSTALLATLSAAAGELVARDRGWPKTPEALSSRLRRAAPALRRMGVVIDSGKSKGQRFVVIYKTSDAPQPSAATPEPDMDGDYDDDDAEGWGRS